MEISEREIEPFFDPVSKEEALLFVRTFNIDTQTLGPVRYYTTNTSSTADHFCAQIELGVEFTDRQLTLFHEPSRGKADLLLGKETFFQARISTGDLLIVSQ